MFNKFYLTFLKCEKIEKSEFKQIKVFYKSPKKQNYKLKI